MRGFMKNNIKHDRKTKRNSNLSREMTYSQDSEANDKLELCITNSIMVENTLRFKNKMFISQYIGILSVLSEVILYYLRGVEIAYLTTKQCSMFNDTVLQTTVLPYYG